MVHESDDADAFFDGLALRSLRAATLVVEDASVYESDAGLSEARLVARLACPFYARSVAGSPAEVGDPASAEGSGPTAPLIDRRAEAWSRAGDRAGSLAAGWPDDGPVAEPVRVARASGLAPLPQRLMAPLFALAAGPTGWSGPPGDRSALPRIL